MPRKESILEFLKSMVRQPNHSLSPPLTFSSEPRTLEWIYGKRIQRRNGSNERNEAGKRNAAGERNEADERNESDERNIGVDCEAPPVVVVRNTQNAPNIILNCHNQFARRELYLVAAFGIALQLGVLVYSGFATYYPKLLFILNGDRVAKYDYPCTAAGTLVLVIGMLICSNIVEDSTSEERYCPADGREARLVWLQKSEIVNDESLGPHAIFPRKAQALITTSQRNKDLEEPKSETESSCSSQDSKVRSNSWQRLLYSWKSREAQTVIGAFLGICGFTVQFIGLRTMHWSASVAQLGAVVVMTILRAWVRRDLADPPKAQPLCPGHELDWLAMTLGGDLTKAPWLYPPEAVGKQTSRPWAGEGEDGWDWKICTVEVRANCEEQEPYPRGLAEDDGMDHMLEPYPRGSNSDTERPKVSLPAKEIGGDGPRQTPELEGRDKHSYLESKADKVMKIRRDLGKLAGWHGPASEEAISLARSIEVTMSALPFPTKRTFTWSLQTYRGEPIHFRLNKPETKTWKACADQIEAALSLWLYSVYDRENPSEVNDIDNKPQTTGEILGQDDNDDWFRAKGTRSKHSLQLLGSYTASLYQDIGWWMPHGIDKVIRVTGPEPTKLEPTKDAIELEMHRVVGYVTSPCTAPIRRDRKCQYKVQTESLGKVTANPPGSGGETAKVILAAESYSSLKALYAQHMFSAFMWAVAETMEKPIPGEVDRRPIETGDKNSDLAWKSFTLQNSLLSKLAQDIQSTGLGTLEEIYLCMIPPLSVKQKLPPVNTIIAWTREYAKLHKQLGHWKEAGDAYIWLVQTAITTKHDGTIYKSIALLVEYLRAIPDAIKLREEQQFEDKDIQELKDLGLGLYKELQKVGVNDILEGLMRLYEIQGRPWECDLVEKSTPKRHKDMLNFTELHKMAHEGDPNIASTLESKKGGINKKDILDWTPLHYAAESSNLDALKQLLRHQANMNTQDIRGGTPLHYACRHNDREIVAYLLRGGAEINIQDIDGIAPIHYAVMSGHMDIVHLLIEFGGAIDLVDGMGYTPLLWAAYTGQEAVVNYLWEDANKKLRDHNGRAPLHLAAVAEVDTVKKEQVIRLLVERGAEKEAKDRFGQTPLHFAAMSGHKAAVQLLLDKGAEKEAKDRFSQTPLHFAARSGDVATVQLLLDRGTGTDKEAMDDWGWTALHRAAERGHKVVVQLLLDRGFKKEAEAYMGWTVLHFAARSGHVAIVQLLLDIHVNVDKKNFYGRTPLHCAARSGQKAVVQLLLDGGARKEEKDNSGWTALDWATEGGREAAKKEVMDQDGWTALHWAPEGAHEAIVRLLELYNAKSLH
jgi:ankyrin repeat protein